MENLHYYWLEALSSQKLLTNAKKNSTSPLIKEKQIKTPFSYLAGEPTSSISRAAGTNVTKPPTCPSASRASPAPAVLTPERQPCGEDDPPTAVTTQASPNCDDLSRSTPHIKNHIKVGFLYLRGFTFSSL